MTNQEKKSGINEVYSTLTLQQDEEILAAILKGKYSYATVLFLKYTGRNALHYLPYRTYNRLIKEVKNEPKTLVQQERASEKGRKSSRSINYDDNE